MTVTMTTRLYPVRWEGRKTRHILEIFLSINYEMLDIEDHRIDFVYHISIMSFFTDIK